MIGIIRKFQRSIVLFAAAVVLFLPSVQAQESGIIINEFSNGASGTKEYIEFLVVGCPGQRVDIRLWKFDDNNGDFSGGPVTGKGIAPGHSRFSNDAQWASVPVGALILMYNSGDKNASITLPDDPSDVNVDSLYVLSHNYTSLIEDCNNYPNTGTGNDNYNLCTSYGPGNWTSIGMRNGGDATQVRKPDGTYFHGFGWGDNNGGPDNLYFAGDGTAKAYSYTSSSCNYRDITNFTSGAAPATETPGAPNNASNLNYIRFLREGITPGTISSNQTICAGTAPNALTESGAVVRCYVNYQWQSSATNAVGSFANIASATSATYAPSVLNATTYYRRIVTNICEHDTSNIVTITVTNPVGGTADQPSTSPTSLCINPANSTFTTNAVANATGYTWALSPASAGTVSSSGTSATIDWNDTYTGTAQVVVSAEGCNGGQPSVPTVITISNSASGAGSDQLNLCSDHTALAASAGAGSWNILSGTGGNITDLSVYNSSFSGAEGQSYTLEWTPSATCGGGADQVQISFAVVPNAPATHDTSSCASKSFVLKASGGTAGEYRWYENNSSTAISGEVNDTYTTPLISSDAVYYISLNNGNCESAKTPLHITIGGSSQGQVHSNVSIVKGQSVTIGTAANGTFQWTPQEALSNPAISNPVASPATTTTYILHAVSSGGCSYTDTVTVSVLCDDVMVPNLITPNNDNLNDAFVIGCTEHMNWKLQIINRWGEIIYQNNNYQNEWKAEGLSNGVYYFYLTSEVLNVSYKGWVEVLN